MMLKRECRWTGMLIGAVLLGGCTQSLDYHVHNIHKKASFKIGEQWMIKPPHEINATSIVVDRQIVQVVEKGVEPPPPRNQRLAIDLTNGRATLEDFDGKVYPQQVELGEVRRIHGHIADRSWQINKIKPQKDAELITHYTLTVYEQDQPLKAQALWANPGREEQVPEVLTLLESTFDVAHRYAYPLSDDVNLLK